jgi:hypothetical protein
MNWILSPLPLTGYQSLDFHMPIIIIGRFQNRLADASVNAIRLPSV